MTMVIDPWRTSDRRIVAFGWDHRTRPQIPDALTKSIGGKAFVTHDPSRHIRQAAKQTWRQGKFVRLTGGKRESDGAPLTIGDHTGLGAVTAARATKRLTLIALRAVDPLFWAPAALWWARMLVPSMKVMQSERSRC